MNGHWIFTVRHYPNGTYMGETWRCSECNSSSFEPSKFPSYELFCHNCGTNMIDKPEIVIKEIVEKEGEFSWE